MKERDSNIELLRIIATFFILIVHCNGWFLQEWGGISTWYEDRGILVGLTRSLIQSVTCIGVNLFILISGYYSIKPKIKSLLNLFSILVFFYLGTYLLNVFVCDVAFTWKHLVKNICAFSRENWFIQCYLFLILLSPILNSFVEKCTNKSLFIYILIFQLCSFYFGNIHESKYFYFNEGYSVTTFILIYLVGRYLKQYGEKYFEDISKKRILVLYVLSLIPISSILLLSNDALRWLGYNSPFLVISSVLLFMLFTKISLRNKFINILGVSCLSVFIFHTCSPIIQWYAEFNIYIYTNYPFLIYLLMMLGGCVCMFTVSIILDKIRLLIAKPIISLTDKFNSIYD